MDTLLYWFGRGLIAFIQSLPLRFVARAGRCIGGLVYQLDARHRRVALKNLQRCFGKELSPDQVKALARENFKRIGENFGCGIKTAGMTDEELGRHVEFIEAAEVLKPSHDGRTRNLVGAIGHFGNFELYARFTNVLKGYKLATTYRGLRQESFNRIFQDIRSKSGCTYFERRKEGAALREFMNQERVALGLLADQHAGANGLRLPFLGEDCSTSAAPAVFALRYDCRLITGFCFRVGLARWRFEIGHEIETHHEGKPRTPAEIMLDVNRSFEKAVRRDPANWFWVHNRWKTPGSRMPPAIEENGPGQPAMPTFC